MRHNTPAVLGEMVDEDLIIVDFNTGHYFTMTGVGGVVWEMLAEGVTPSQLTDAFQSAYPEADPDHVAESIEQLLGAMLAEQLITETDGTQAGVTDLPSGGHEGFEAPTLVKYTDMADLLLLDPIHEVDPAGWPHQQPGEAHGR